MNSNSMEISPADDVCAFLQASGYTQEECRFVIDHLGKMTPSVVSYLTADRRVQMVETLSLCWLVLELRRHATGPVGSIAAVEALKILADITLRAPDLFKS